MHLYYLFIIGLYWQSNNQAIASIHTINPQPMDEIKFFLIPEAVLHRSISQDITRHVYLWATEKKDSIYLLKVLYILCTNTVYCIAAGVEM